MNVHLLPADEFGCGYYRMRLPAAYSGEACTFDDKLRVKGSNGRPTYVEVGEADVVVFQRPMTLQLTLSMMQLQKQGVACVVELDDDLCSLDTKHFAYKALHPRYNAEANWQHLKDACARADLVTVSTPELARRYAGHGRYVVIENYIEDRLLQIDPERAYDIGWGGALGTHPNDLGVMSLAIRDLMDEGHSFRVVGEGAGIKDVLWLRDEVDATGWLEIDDYYRELAKLRVGLVPLHTTAFNHAKSWLKGLEYAALGVPFVASDMPEYNRLQAHGIGMIAAKPKHWKRMVKQLLDDESLRHSLSVLGRKAAGELTIQKHGWRWAEAWNEAIVNRHAKVAA